MQLARKACSWRDTKGCAVSGAARCEAAAACRHPLEQRTAPCSRRKPVGLRADRSRPSRQLCLPQGQPRSQEPSLGNSSRKSKRARLMAGLRTTCFWFRGPKLCTRGQSMALPFLRALSLNALQTGILHHWYSWPSWQETS